MKLGLPLLLSTIGSALSLQLLELRAVLLDNSCEILSLKHSQPHRTIPTSNETYVERQLLPTEKHELQSTLLRIYGSTKVALMQRLKAECVHLAYEPEETNHSLHDITAQVPLEGYTPLNDLAPLPPPPKLSVTPLHISGPSDNRIDLVFFADGYQASEERNFLEDAARLANDISANQTFATVRPLLNIWAAFTPSSDTGIGTDSAPKDTAFGLYRVGTELRAIYCGKKPVARSACASLGTGCDYPILLANDPYYGGLGGEFSITTSSILNGALVLRHELGHSIIDVGEEYDGGYAYYGPNSSPYRLESTIKWQKWLSDPLKASNAAIIPERAVSPLQAYPWTLLNHSTPYTALFNSSGTYSSYLLRFSLSGLPQDSDLTVLLDGKDVKWKPRRDVGMDRWHYDILRDESLTLGVHNFSFVLGDTAVVGKAQLCSLEIIEYGDESEFNRTAGNIAAYPTFSMWNGTTYRPTSEGCLMRQVVLPHFCRPCIEGLWLALLKRVDLIDKFSVLWDASEENAFVQLKTLGLGQFRGDVPSHKESLEIGWVINGTIKPEYANKTHILLPRNDAIGNWTVSVTLHTDEVREDPKGYLSSSRHISV